jgi:hypothetical protein
MANNLDRELNIGEKVILLQGVFKSEFDTPEHRIVEIAGDTFGNHAFTTGTALIVKIYTGDLVRLSGYDIDKDATNKLAVSTVS